MSGPAPRRGKTRVVVARPVTRIVSPYARRRLTETSGPFTLIKDHLAGGAPRLAALLLPQILPVLPPHRAQHARWGPRRAVVAPLRPGAPRSVVCAVGWRPGAALRNPLHN